MLCFIHDATHPFSRSLPLAGFSNPRAATPPQSPRTRGPSIMRTRAHAALRLVSCARPCRVRWRSVRPGCPATCPGCSGHDASSHHQSQTASARGDRSLVLPGRPLRHESLGQAVLAHLHRLPGERKTARLLPVHRRQRKCSLGLPARPHLGGSGPKMSLQMHERFRRGFGGGLWLVAFVASSLPAPSAAPPLAFLRRPYAGHRTAVPRTPPAPPWPQQKAPCSIFSLFPGQADFHTAFPGPMPVKRALHVPMYTREAP